MNQVVSQGNGEAILCVFNKDAPFWQIWVGICPKADLTEQAGYQDQSVSKSWTEDVFLSSFTAVSSFWSAELYLFFITFFTSFTIKFS